MMAPGIGFCHTFAQAAFAFFIQAFAFPRQLTLLFCATYHVQFPQANPRESPVYFTVYRDFSPVAVSISVGLVLGSLVGTGLSILVADVFAVGLSIFFCSISRAAPGIMRSIPLRIEAASRRLFTRTISSGSTPYRLAISETVSPETTV